MNKKIGFIGGGKMAQAIMQGIIGSKILEKSAIFVSDPNSETTQRVRKNLGINIAENNISLVKAVDIVFLATKPFVIKDILAEIKPIITKDQSLLTILAGVSTHFIERTLDIPLSIVRIMPNTPALVNEGMSAIVGGSFAKTEDINFTKKLFSSLGKVVETDEDKIDIITALSGSSPAFFYYFINEIAKSAEKLGLDYKTAILASAQTALGSAKMIMDSGIIPETLIDNVTTKGGCTEVGMDVLKEKNVDKIIFETIFKTAQKASKLGE